MSPRRTDTAGCLPQPEHVREAGRSSDTVILTIAFLPPAEWFRAAALSGRVLIEGCESYQKQSYRSRCRILAADGVETLNVPVVHGESRNIRDIRIDYSEAWPRRLERALTAAYRSSPFFIYYQDDILPLMNSGETSLFEYDMALIKTVTELLGLRITYDVTSEFLKDCPGPDYRYAIHPKRPVPPELAMDRSYYQVFGGRTGFTPSLSVLDLLFNEGPNAISYIL